MEKGKRLKLFGFGATVLFLLLTLAPASSATINNGPHVVFSVYEVIDGQLFLIQIWSNGRISMTPIYTETNQ
jgi:hypothetical protein